MQVSSSQQLVYFQPLPTLQVSGHLLATVLQMRLDSWGVSFCRSSRNKRSTLNFDTCVSARNESFPAVTPSPPKRFETSAASLFTLGSCARGRLGYWTRCDWVFCHLRSILQLVYRFFSAFRESLHLPVFAITVLVTSHCHHRRCLRLRLSLLPSLVESVSALTSETLAFGYH